MEITASKLKELYDQMVTFYSKDHKRMNLLDATDRGNLWKALKAKFPPYQILPDTNYVSYVKNNILASIYTVMKSAAVEPTSDKDKQICMDINIAMEKIWDLSNVGFYQFQAGERAALLNIGLTQVGWDDRVTAGSGDYFYKGNVTLKNWNPMKFMRDPFAEDLDTSGYAVVFDDFHKSVFLENPNYVEKFKAYIAKKNQTVVPHPESDEQARIPKGNAKDYYTLFVYWVKEDVTVEEEKDGEKNSKAEVQVHEIHVINNEDILWEKKNIKPSTIPIADLYCNLPAGALVGSSECTKIFANNVAYNLMDSIALTAEYKNQRPPKFVNSQSGLNIRAFSKHGDEADKTFVVNGDASKAVHYQQFPYVSPSLPTMKMSLENGMQLVTGVDGRYTGRDTGSIITTGGTEEMLNRVTLIDTPKILMYERYVKRLTQLILANFIEFSPKRSYFYKKPNSTKWDSVTVDFPDLKKNQKTLFNYTINISSELPKNKQRIAAMATMLMEKQMQYQEQGKSVTLVTEEEWLMMQDLPMKEFMLERMGLQRMQDTVAEVSQALFQFADLTKKGMGPHDAINAIAQTINNQRQGMMPQEGPLGPMVSQDTPGMDLMMNQMMSPVE